MDEEPALTIDIDGWEGPLDLLLALARTQKVDLRELSILALVEQYLAYVEQARSLRLELAADYLVMAAWLALLKSALLLPKDPEADPDPELLAARLHLRLQRLDAMRDAGARLMARDRIGRDVFVRGDPEGLEVVRRAAWQADLYELLAAYGRVRARTAPVLHVVARRPVMTLEEALRRMERMLGRLSGWQALDRFLPSTRDPDMAVSARASSFLAALELAKRGQVELAQDGAFAPLMIRAA
ncbi:segregation and condensation protein A [Sphingomonas quercus]|uniref:Segregation and condensation protein A n=1 Tax=Sphingomonas quercus TaxID=2842451 RepID=A0ABS6BJU3_9SPHN|nr:ScpA family protein [Sphingomonas quercus]MBU3078454.1 segregation/condensation protein A [Sphingomonas quercus]